MTTRQRAALRAMANTIDPVLHIGKDGINDNLAKQAWDALEARELIKVTVQKNAPMDAREACAELCERVHAEAVQVIGSRFVIYRQAREDSKIRLGGPLSPPSPEQPPGNGRLFPSQRRQQQRHKRRAQIEGIAQKQVHRQL